MSGSWNTVADTCRKYLLIRLLEVFNLFLWQWDKPSIEPKTPGLRSEYKDCLSGCGDFHIKDKTVMRLSFL